MNFEMLLDEIINLSGEEQLNYLSKFKDYDFSKEELFEIFSLVEEVNYEKFYLMFKELLSKLGMLDYYLLVINMNKDLNNFSKYGRSENMDSYFKYLLKSNDLSYEEDNLYYNNLLKLSSNVIRRLSEDKINILSNMVYERIRSNKNISFNELSFIGVSTLKELGLISISNKINNTILDGAYGYTNFKLYMLTKPECKIQLDYNRLEKEFNGEELLFRLLYTLFHEIEHVKQVNFCLSRDSYKNDLSKKLAVSYKRGFFIESLVGHSNMEDYDNITIEYNAKLLGMIRTLSFIKENFSSLFNESFIRDKYLEVNKIILDNYLNYRKFNSLFSKYDSVYNDSQYKEDFDKTLTILNFNSKLVNYGNRFLDEQFMLLLMGEDNIFRRIILKKNISFDEQENLILDSIYKKDSKKRS